MPPSTLSPADPAAETADNASANDEYVDPVSATAGAPVPPRILPDEVAAVQSPDQGGDTGETGAQPAPGAGGRDDGAERLTSGYDKATQAELDAEIDARRAEGREIEVTGTGRDGAVVNADRASALEADDKAASA
jgi:hypothetical protein